MSILCECRIETSSLKKYYVSMLRVGLDACTCVLVQVFAPTFKGYSTHGLLLKNKLQAETYASTCNRFKLLYFSAS